MKIGRFEDLVMEYNPPVFYNVFVGPHSWRSRFAHKRIFLAMNNIIIRHIKQNDNATIAAIIRKTLEEFGANHPGTVYYDDATDALYELFSSTPRSVYFIAEKDGIIVGGGGIYPTMGLPNNTCELVKMYLLPGARGIGLGKRLINQCIDFAESVGYKNIYLETMTELKQALNVYERMGFTYLDAPMGNSGHHGCELWMIKAIS